MLELGFAVAVQRQVPERLADDLLFAPVEFCAGRAIGVDDRAIGRQQPGERPKPIEHPVQLRPCFRDLGSLAEADEISGDRRRRCEAGANHQHHQPCTDRVAASSDRNGDRPGAATEIEDALVRRCRVVALQSIRRESEPRSARPHRQRFGRRVRRWLVPRLWLARRSVMVPVATPTTEPARSRAGTTRITPSAVLSSNVIGRLTTSSKVLIDWLISAAR